MGYHARIESRTLGSFLTTRSRNSELWFVNNKRLEESILGFAAKYSNRYSVKLFALAIEGNHIQGPALFPKANRSEFMRDFNSSVARAVPKFVKEYRGGRFWARRYSAEFLPSAEDIEEYFFYTVLQPIKDGLVEKLSDYPGYNCFHDAVYGVKRKFKVVRWAEYNSAKRFNSKISISDFVDEVTLQFERVPGYEHLTQDEYAKMMCKKFEERRKAIVEERRKRGLRIAGKRALLRKQPGKIPLKTKTSKPYEHRPRVLSVCNKRRAEYRAWYYRIFSEFKAASSKYRAGDLLAEFPEGTFRPYLKLVVSLE